MMTTMDVRDNKDRSLMGSGSGEATEHHGSHIRHWLFLAGIFHPAWDSGGCRLWIAGVDAGGRRYSTCGAHRGGCRRR
jgi:hypothetical protein